MNPANPRPPEPPESPGHATRHGRDDDAIDCSLHQARLGHELDDTDTPLSESATAAQGRHREVCSACRGAHQSALLAARTWRALPAPEPPSGFADRVLLRLSLEATGATVCAEIAGHLHEWAAGELAPPRAARFAAHAESCARCAALDREARAMKATLPAWRAPVPPASLAARVLAATSLAPRGSRLTRLLPAAGLLAAAALLLAILSRDERPTPREIERADAHRVTMTAVERLAQDRERLIRSVRWEVQPAAVGSFEPLSTLADRTARRSGNALHRSLRRATAGGDGSHASRDEGR